MAAKKAYRVFVTRHYIACEFFDVRATSPGRARALAKQAAYKIARDPRNDAQDNGWLTDNAITLPHGVGSYPDGEKVALRTISPDVFQFKTKLRKRSLTAGDATK